MDLPSGQVEPVIAVRFFPLPILPGDGRSNASDPGRVATAYSFFQGLLHLSPVKFPFKRVADENEEIARAVKKEIPAQEGLAPGDNPAISRKVFRDIGITGDELFLSRRKHLFPLFEGSYRIAFFPEHPLDPLHVG
jgi:hypothetical protein